MAGKPNDTLLIEARGITKVFKDFWGRPKVRAVTDLDIAVRQGSIFGLLGPNGAGKSTTIKMILGHLYPTSGVLRVLGRDPRDVEAKQRLGYLPERSTFYRNLTAEEVLMLFGELLGLSRPEIRRRSEQLLEMVGLQGARRRAVGGFSHGMGRRLGLAQALLNDPDLLLLDEPTAGLDPIGCHEVKTLIQTLAQRGKTVLLCSHLLSDVQDLCDEIMIVYGGKVQQTGPVSELLASREQIQLRSPVVSEKLLSQARDLFAREVPADDVRIETPTRSLESYFLEVVHSANASRTATAGAQMGTGVATYLRDEAQGQEVLDELTRQEAAPEQAQPVPPGGVEAEAPAKVDTGALDALTAPKTEQAGGDEGKDDDFDQDLLDRLTK